MNAESPQTLPSLGIRLSKSPLFPEFPRRAALTRLRPHEVYLSVAGQPAPILDKDGDGLETVVIRFHVAGTLKPTQAVYSCSRDGGANSSCSSPHSFRVALGTHTFSVAARTKTGNLVDKTPAKVSFDVVSAPKPPPPPPPAEYKFSDEFDGLAGSAPDPMKWQEIFGGSSPPRWGIECFVNDREHIALDGLGNLIVTATAAPASPCTADRGGPGILSAGWPTSSSYPRPVVRDRLPHVHGPLGTGPNHIPHGRSADSELERCGRGGEGLQLALRHRGVHPARDRRPPDGRSRGSCGYEHAAGHDDGRLHPGCGVVMRLSV